MESPVLAELVEQITCCDVFYEDIEACVPNSNEFVGQFHDKLNELKARSPIAQLWVQYFEMISIALDFNRAERLELFKEHLDAVRKILPYSHACGHFYMRNLLIYIFNIW